MTEHSISLPTREEMLVAFQTRDTSYEGIFVTAVLTTGIFCRPSCSARKPLPENVEFFQTTKEALDRGYRPCKRCRPMEPLESAPEWIRPLLDAVDKDPLRRWKDQDLRNQGWDPERVRRYFQRHHGMTFHAFSRSRRLGHALGRMKAGTPIVEAGLDAEYESTSGFRDAISRVTGSPAAASLNKTMIHPHRIETPLGPMLAGADDASVVLLEFVDRPMLPTQLERIQKRFNAVAVQGANPVIEQLEGELGEYFNGKRREFEVALRYPGTDFQERTWSALREIPYGATWSYQDLARRLGDTNAVRAVARANGDNRIAILIPCHRVIGKDGSLTGYGGGLHRKRFLLELETGARTGDLFA